MKLHSTIHGLTALILAMASAFAADDAASLCADRTAIERVYYEHRLGQKPPFEQVLPADAGAGHSASSGADLLAA
jgi:O-methyltransferase involved in polyketide biosynthesis